VKRSDYNAGFGSVASWIDSLDVVRDTRGCPQGIATAETTNLPTSRRCVSWHGHRRAGMAAISNLEPRYAAIAHACAPGLLAAPQPRRPEGQCLHSHK